MAARDILAASAAIAIGGAVALTVGLPLAWEIDRRVMLLTDPYGEGSYTLPPHEMTPVDPSSLTLALR